MGKLAIGMFSVLASSVAACDKAPSTAPSSTLAPPVNLQRLELEVEGARVVSRSPWGEAVVVPPGQTVQLRARGYLQDGSSRDVTSQSSWVWLPDGDNNFFGGQFAVHNGLVSAPACPAGEACRTMGAWVVTANYFSLVEARRTVLVLTDGSFAVGGLVTEAVSGRPIANAVVELSHSATASRLVSRTGDDGRFRALGVANGAEIRVSGGDDYESLHQRLTLSDNDPQLSFSLNSKGCGVAAVFAPPTGVVTEIADSVGIYCWDRVYSITAPSNGMLVARLTWNPPRGSAELHLTLGGMLFRASPPNLSPVVGRVDVVAGQTTRVVVSHTDYWGYSWDPFLLTISLE